jgi:hypothetical protein
LRVDLGEDRAIGPGKIRLLEAIRDAGSITKAGIALAAAPSSAPASPELDELPVDIPKTRAVKRDNVTLPITGEVEQSAQIEMLGSDDITVEKDYLLPPPFSS